MRHPFAQVWIAAAILAALLGAAVPASSETVAGLSFRSGRDGLGPVPLSLPRLGQGPEETWKPKTHPWLAALEVLGINAGVWAVDRFIVNDATARIGWSTWKANLKDGFAFDNDKFLMNFVGHPFHGSQYFNSARSLGMSYWASLPYAFAGSLMWEYFGETTQPSTDDLILTTGVGSYYGEVMFRMSSQILDDSATGGNRAVREVAAFLIDPIRGLNRVISGEAWRVESASHQFKESVVGSFAVGPAFFSLKPGLTGAKADLDLELEFVYGDSDWRNPSPGPFNLIVFDGILRFGNNFNSRLMSYAPLVAKFKQNDRGQKFMYGLFQDVDYIKNETIELGGTSLMGGVIASWPIGKGFSFSTAAQAGAMVFGASNNPLVLIGQRNYNYGLGPAGKLDLIFSHPSGASLLLRAAHFQIFSFEASSPEALETRDAFTYLRAQLTVPVLRWLGVRADYTAFLRDTHFEEMPTFTQNYYLLGASLVFRI